MNHQQTLMKFDPATGVEKPYPSHADQWRKYHGSQAWLFNPWTGERRHASDVGSDVFGLLVWAPGEQLYAEQRSSSAMGCAMRQGAIMGADACQSASIGRGASA